MGPLTISTASRATDDDDLLQRSELVGIAIQEARWWCGSLGFSNTCGKTHSSIFSVVS